MGDPPSRLIFVAFRSFKCQLTSKSLELTDSLYGGNGTLTALEEGGFEEAGFIVGVNGFSRVVKVFPEQPAAQWTALISKDARGSTPMAGEKLCFEEATGKLHGHKQGTQNQRKDLLREVGLHAMPCGKADVDAVFLAVAGIATSLTMGYARLRLGRASMTLWRFGRDVLELPARIPRHAGGVSRVSLGRARMTVPRTRRRLRQTRRPGTQQTPSQSNIKWTVRQTPNTPQPL